MNWAMMVPVMVTTVEIVRLRLSAAPMKRTRPSCFGLAKHAEAVARSRSGHTTSHHEICGSGWWTMHCCATCRDGHLAAWLPDVFRPWLSMRPLRRWLDENKEGREPRDAVDAIIPILREKCDRVGEAGVPISASVMQPIFNRVADQHGMARKFGKRWIRHFLRCAGFRYRAASGGTKKTTDPKLLDTHMDKLRLRLIYYVTEHRVHPSCIINMDETAAKLLESGMPWRHQPGRFACGKVSGGASSVATQSHKALVCCSSKLGFPTRLFFRAGGLCCISSLVAALCLTRARKSSSACRSCQAVTGGPARRVKNRSMGK